MKLIQWLKAKFKRTKVRQYVHVKVIYGWHNKTQRQIHRILELEVEQINKRFPYLKLQKIEPPLRVDGMLVYKFIFV